MRHLHWSAVLAALAAQVCAQDVVYVTDLEIYTLLAPCAQYGLSYPIFDLTWSTSSCNGGISNLHACACSNTADRSAVQSSISEQVMLSCSSASQDLSSAEMVFDKYCNPDRVVTFATPAGDPVDIYITDLPETERLAPCARVVLGWAVQDAPSSYCPRDASLFAPCACERTDIVEMVTSSLASLAQSSCSNREDVTSALDFYSAYCNLINGTSSFPPAPRPSGDMTYHITDLPDFKSLRDCAQTGVSSAISIQTYDFCGSDSQAMASCICLKSGMSRRVSTYLTSYVKDACSNTATADLSSAVDVFRYYCSAASGLVEAAVDVPRPTSTSGGGGESAPPPPSRTSTTSIMETGGSDGANGGSANESDQSDGVSRVAAIAGGVVGGVVAIIAVSLVAFFVRRRRQKQEKGEQLAPSDDNHGREAYNGKPELAGPDPVTPPVPPVPELTNSQAPTPELQGATASGYSMPYGQPPQELASSGVQPSQPYLNGQPVAEFPSPVTPATPAQQQTWQQSQVSGMSWQSGPVQSYEMEANPVRRH
ncbi:hypothetical protein B0I35DRAFT_349956 [Stachybotrys elegans]|uniref:Extracellular membrane protein CFEM domain-containing protein n=1 Tax=Stachybotrys elegans TaxID=80388 RepID=A0A8K0SXS0_9HYPO|nr:hypothetical protein B0I35DRAFT_349956 [Stachybotrys elegans]